MPYCTPSRAEVIAFILKRIEPATPELAERMRRQGWSEADIAREMDSHAGDLLGMCSLYLAFTKVELPRAD